MAVWQFPFALIYQNSERFPLDYVLNESSRAVLAQTLAPRAHWCEKVELYGDLSGTCVEISIEGTTPEENFVRLHVGALSRKEVDAILEFAAVNQLNLFYKGQVCKPSWDNLKAWILASDACRFCENPEEFLETLISPSK